MLALALIGRAVGDNWEDWRHNLGYLDYVGRWRRSSSAVVYLVVKRRRTRAAERGLSRRGARTGFRAAARRALGLVQGPAELLPVSSSAHIVLVPWLAGWDWEEIDPEVRKSFEVALHTGAAAALLIGQRRVIAEELREFDRRRALLAGALLPAGGGRRLHASSGRSSGGSAGRGRPPTACSPERRRCSSPTRRPQLRGRGEATAADGLALGRRAGGGAGAGRLAQRDHAGGGALARLLARRRRTCSRARSRCRSSSAPPALKGARLARRGASPELRRSLAIGAGASFASTLASQRLIGLVERDRALWPYAAYRAALAAVVLKRLHYRASRSPRLLAFFAPIGALMRQQTGAAAGGRGACENRRDE